MIIRFDPVILKYLKFEPNFAFLVSPFVSCKYGAVLKNLIFLNKLLITVLPQVEYYCVKSKCVNFMLYSHSKFSSLQTVQ